MLHWQWHNVLLLLRVVAVLRLAPACSVQFVHFHHHHHHLLFVVVVILAFCDSFVAGTQPGFQKL